MPPTDLVGAEVSSLILAQPGSDLGVELLRSLLAGSDLGVEL